MSHLIRVMKAKSTGVHAPFCHYTPNPSTPSNYWDTLSHLSTPLISDAGNNNLLTTHLWYGVSSNSWKIQVGRICSGHEKSNSIKPHPIPAPHLTSPHLATLGHSPPPPCRHHGCRTAQRCRTPCRRQQCNHTVMGAPDHHKQHRYGCQGNSLA